MARSDLVLSFISALKPRSPTAWLFYGKPGLGRENNMLTTHFGQHFFFPWRSPCFAIGFCLFGLNECGTSGNLALWRLLMKGGSKFLVFTGMMVFDMSFSESLFGNDGKETWCQRRVDWVWVGAKQLSELEVGVTIVAVIKSSGVEQGMISVTVSLCISVTCPFKETWFSSVLWPLWAQLKEVEKCSAGLL